MVDDILYDFRRSKFTNYASVRFLLSIVIMHNIQQEDNKQNGFFYIEEEGNRLAEVGYTWRGADVMSIDHTEVSEQLEGKGVGSNLMKHIVAFAREKGIKLKLYCSFAKTAFQRHPEWSDVL